MSGNPLATAAGTATLKLLRDEPPYEKLERLGARLAQGLGDAARAAGVPYRMQRVGSMMTLFFIDQDVYSWREAQHCDRARFARYFWGLVDEGVYMPCSQFEALFFSQTHSEEHIEQTIDAAARVLKSLS